MLGALLRASGTTLDHCAAIAVNPGPGRFSSIRLGVLLANTLAWARNIPIVVRGEMVPYAVPEYDRPPSITIPRMSPL